MLYVMSIHIDSLYTLICSFYSHIAFILFIKHTYLYQCCIVVYKNIVEIFCNILLGSIGKYKFTWIIVYRFLAFLNSRLLPFDEKIIIIESLNYF